jgi:hypothetical protein
MNTTGIQDTQPISPPETNPITQGSTLRERVKTAVANVFKKIGELFKKIIICLFAPIVIALVMMVKVYYPVVIKQQFQSPQVGV